MDVIVRQEDGVWGAWSPNAKGFFAGADTEEELRTMLQDGIRFWYENEGIEGELKVRIHSEVALPGTPFVVRITQDDHRDERMEVFRRVWASWADGGEEQQYQWREQTAANLSSSGEAIVVAAVPSDSLRSLVDQMTDNDRLIVATGVADELLLTFAVANGGLEGPTKEMGRDETVADVVPRVTAWADKRELATVNVGAAGVEIVSAGLGAGGKLGWSERVSLPMDFEDALRTLMGSGPHPPEDS